MKIKHFAGYGSVTAKVESRSSNTIVIHVWGSHERGVLLEDADDVFNWLCRKLDKKRWKEYESVFCPIDTKVESWWEEGERYDEEHCRYTITYRNYR